MARLKASKRLSILVALVLSLSLAMAVPAAAVGPQTEVVLGGAVAPSCNAHGSTVQKWVGDGSWWVQNEASKFELYIDPTVPPFDALGTFQIDDIASISYHTYKPGSQGDPDFYLLIYTTTDTIDDQSSWYGYRLNAEPYFSQDLVAPSNQWNTWSTDDGTNQLTFFDSSKTGGVYGFYGQPTLQDLQADVINWHDYDSDYDDQDIDYGAETVKYISFQTGTGWFGSFEGYIDAIEIALSGGTTVTVDLEAYADEVWVNDDWAGSTPGVEVEAGKFFGFNAFATIQDGIDNVASSTVHVAAGTYNERLLINKSLDLRGAQYGVDPTATGARTNPANESTIDVTGLPRLNPDVAVQINNGVDNVTMDGFTILGKNFVHAEDSVVRSGTTGGTTDDITVSNDIIDGAYGVIFFNGDNILVRQNRMTIDKNGVCVKTSGSNVAVSDNIISPAATMADDDPSGVYVNSCIGVEISGNALTDLVGTGSPAYGEGIMAPRCADAVISRNKITGMGLSGIMMWGCPGDCPQNIEISDNEISNNGVAEPRYDAGGMAISGEDITIRGNEVLNNGGDGVRIDHSNNVRTTIHFNNIHGNANYGVNVISSQDTVNATHNWWGDASGPTHTGNPGGSGDAVSDNVSYQPWLGAPLELPAVHHETLGAGTHVVDASDEADTIVTLNATGPTEIYIARYASQPFPDEPFPDEALGKWIDVHVSNSSAVEWPIYVQVYYTDAEVLAAGIDESTLGLYYYQSVDTFHRCSDTGVDTAENFIWANVTSEEAGYLAFTPFGAGGNPLPPPPPVGGTAYPINKLAILAPWIALAVVIMVGASLVLKRRRASDR